MSHPGGSWIPRWSGKIKEVKATLPFPKRNLIKNKTSSCELQLRSGNRNKLSGKKTWNWQMSRSEILAVSCQQRPALTKWGYAESTQKHPFHDHHQPFRRTVIIFWARAPPAIISQSRSLFLEFSTFSRSCSNLISFPSYGSCVFLQLLNRSSSSVFLKFRTHKDISIQL